MSEQEETFTLDAVNLIPTDELIDELLNRFPTTVIGYVDEEGQVRINWDGCYPTAVGLSKLLSELIMEDCEVT